MCALSGGPDSTALVALARAADLEVTAVHVDHGLRPDSARDAATAAEAARALGATFRRERIELRDGPDLEARARRARLAVVGPRAMTGHTADDQAETVLLALLRGSGARGLAAMTPGGRHPILELRRHETRSLCHDLGLVTVDDPSNRDPRFRRNRVRAEVLPLLDDVAERDVTALIGRAATLLRDDDALLEELAASIDPTDASALARADPPLARRAVRRWLERGGHPPGADSVERVLAVARGSARACEVTGVGRVARTAGRLRVEAPAPSGRPGAGRAGSISPSGADGLS
ncbi:tRNA lysidine(34) synthetase TilS [Ilumatobacter sp.]|uniref:tRNA lysidine(34) synthetase TilS n=1 Tax=Ilumatobacter sp. TaxID=1967498 RepID=UPI003B51D5FD